MIEDKPRGRNSSNRLMSATTNTNWKTQTQNKFIFSENPTVGDIGYQLDFDPNAIKFKNKGNESRNRRLA